MNNSNINKEVIDDKSISIDHKLFPSAIHYDDLTILNQNGCLMQTIEISSNKMSYCNVMNIIEHVIRKEEGIMDFAFYVNVLRRDINLEQKLTSNNEDLYFLHYIQNHWSNINNFKHGDLLNNHLYLTVVIKNNIYEKINFGDFFFFLLKARFFKKLALLQQKLTSFVNKIIKALEDNHLYINVLKMHCNEGKFSSDYLYFFHLLLFCQDCNAIKNADFSYLIFENSKFIFDFNTIQIVKNEEKILATTFAIKSDYYLTEYAVRKLLTLPIIFNITQVFNFIHNNASVADFKKQYRLLSVSKSNDLIKSLKMKQSLRNKKDFALSAIQTTTFTIYGFNSVELKNSINLFNQTCQECGLLANRLDLRLEEIFWNQLPGNLILANYKNFYIDRYGSFLYTINEANLNKKISNLQYGKILTVNQEDDHFIIRIISDNNKINFIGGDYCQIILNFFLTFTMQENVRIILIDFDQRSRLIFNALGFKYFRITESNKMKNKKIGLNVLSLCGNELGNKYLVEILILMIEKQNQTTSDIKDHNERQNLRNVLQNIVEKIANDANIHCLSDCLTLFQEENIQISNWIGDGDWGGIFDNDFALEFEKDSIAFDVSEISDAELQSIVNDFLLYYVQKDQQEQKTIFAINNFLSFYEKSSIFHDKLSQFVVNMEALGIFPIFIEKDYTKLMEYKEDVLIEIIDSFIFTQGENLDKITKILNVDQKILINFPEMTSFNNKIILLYDSVTYILNMHLTSMNEYLFFSSNEKSIIDKVRKLKKEHGKDVKIWLQKLYEKINL